MSAQQAVQGLACPRCGGMVPIPEGQVIVNCPFCDLRSLVRGERGVQRYQVPQKINRDQAVQAVHKFLTGSLAIARDAASISKIDDIFLVHLPFWSHRARVLGWVFGEKRVSSGKSSHYEPREKTSAQDMLWDGAACDVSEFGVGRVDLAGKPLEPFKPDALHATGMVFEPVSSASDARSAAEAYFIQNVQNAADLSRISQIFVRFASWLNSLVYYPLWVLRYSYHGRSFQVVVDGFSGQVLYGKAPSSTMFRAARLVLGIAAGALISIDGSALAFYLGAESSSKDSGGIFLVGLAALVGGFAMMFSSYRAYRFGEHYEFRLNAPKEDTFASVKSTFSKVENLTSWLNQ